ncbi:dephospho-CoA kinase [bacterium]|nr:dephospho-CoA kinase [bacterium]
MKIIGITGGIASGKSTVSLYLEDKYDAYIFDADKEAKALQQSSFVKDKILQSFPNLEDFSASSIAKEVFQNSESQSKINNIIHPMISDLIIERINEKKDLHNIFVVDAALIIESGIFEQHQKNGAKLILIISDEEIRLKRAILRDNLGEKTIKDRMSLQMNDDEKSKYSDYVVENNSSEFELFSKIDEIIKKII